MKVAAVLAIHRRPEITLVTLERLKRQTVPIEICVAGDSEIELTVAQQAGVHYVEHENLPLAAKYQAAVNLARTLNPDAIVTTGSDSWFSDNWCEVVLEELAKNNWDAAAKNKFAAMWLDEEIEIVERSYGPNRASIPDGNGRMVTAAGLDKMDWQLYPVGFRGMNGIDSASHQRCLDHRLKTGIVNYRDDIKVMEIKSPKWASINGFVAMRQGVGLVGYPRIDKPEKWLDWYFPGWREELNGLH
jgi:hypothetical protein